MLSVPRLLKRLGDCAEPGASWDIPQNFRGLRNFTQKNSGRQKPVTVGWWDLTLTLAVWDSSVHSSKTEQSSRHSSQPYLLGHLQPGPVKRCCCLQFLQAKRFICKVPLTQGAAVGTFSGLCSLIIQVQFPSVLARSSCLTTALHLNCPHTQVCTQIQRRK